MINQLQNVSSQRSLSTAYRMSAILYTVDKDLRVETSGSGYIIRVLLKNLVSMGCRNCRMPVLSAYSEESKVFICVSKVEG